MTPYESCDMEYVTSKSRKLSSLRRNIIRPLLHEFQTSQSGGVISWTGSEMNQEYSKLCDQFNQLTVATTQNSIGLNHWIRKEPITVLLFSKQADAYLARFESYFEKVGFKLFSGQKFLGIKFETNQSSHFVFAVDYLIVYPMTWSKE